MIRPEITTIAEAMKDETKSQLNSECDTMRFADNADIDVYLKNDSIHLFICQVNIPLEPQEYIHLKLIFLERKNARYNFLLNWATDSLKPSKL